MSHWHSPCPLTPSKCRLLIEVPQGTYVNESHSQKHEGIPVEACQEMFPKNFLAYIRQFGKPCDDRACSINEKEQGIAV